LINLGNGPSAWQGWISGIRSTGQFRFTVEGGGGLVQELYADTTDCVPVGAWTHIVGVYTGTVSRLYRDGVLEEETPIPYSSINFGSVGLVVGRHSYFNNRYYPGLVDELAVWDQVLTDRQVVQLFSQGKMGARIVP
jgi:hypothetical protein